MTSAARMLLDCGAVNIRPQDPFTLTSGKKSPVYVDCRRMIGFPQQRRALMTMLAEKLEQVCGRNAFDAVAGGETAGIPYAAWLAEAWHLPMQYVRKKPKGFGRMAQIEGVLEQDMRVLLVEDMATDGGSKVVFVNALRAAGALVEECAVLFHYGIFDYDRSELAACGIRLHSLCTWNDVLAEARDARLVSPADFAEVRLFLDDPAGWQEKNR